MYSVLPLVRDKFSLYDSVPMPSSMDGSPAASLILSESTLLPRLMQSSSSLKGSYSGMGGSSALQGGGISYKIMVPPVVPTSNLGGPP